LKQRHRIHSFNIRGIFPERTPQGMSGSWCFIIIAPAQLYGAFVMTLMPHFSLVDFNALIIIMAKNF